MFKYLNCIYAFAWSSPKQSSANLSCPKKILKSYLARSRLFGMHATTFPKQHLREKCLTLLPFTTWFTGKPERNSVFRQTLLLERETELPKPIREEETNSLNLQSFRWIWMRGSSGLSTGQMESLLPSPRFRRGRKFRLT